MQTFFYKFLTNRAFSSAAGHQTLFRADIIQNIIFILYGSKSKLLFLTGYKTGSI